MSEPLTHLRALISHPSDAVRWACLLEATSPKVGNVYPGRSFGDLCYPDYVAAADITATRIGRSERRVSERMLRAVLESVSQAKSNVNLGIVLLVGPLVAADEVLLLREVQNRTGQAWLSAIAEALGELDGVDGQNIYRAIDMASPGGLGRVDTMDVHDSDGEVHIIEAMKLAADRDRIARQYATGFLDLIENVIPIISQSLAQRGDALAGIGRAHLLLLQSEPDSLIERKNGREKAIEVMQRAAEVDPDDPVGVADLDAWLRSDANKLNPGATADLIAAALYILLRSPEGVWPN